MIWYQDKPQERPEVTDFPLQVGLHRIISRNDTCWKAMHMERNMDDALIEKADRE